MADYAIQSAIMLTGINSLSDDADSTVLAEWKSTVREIALYNI